MSDTFRAATGRKVVSRATADVVGAATHFVVDATDQRVEAIVVGKGRKARFVPWDGLSGFGPDAIMIVDEQALAEADGDRERAAVSGKLELLGKRALSELGTELGTIDDVVFDPDTGRLESLVVEDQEVPAAVLLGSGSYAVVLGQGALPA